jgi:hypothetical protein
LLPEDVATWSPNGIVVRLVLAERLLVNGGQARRLFSHILAEIGQDGGAVDLTSGTEWKPAVGAVHVCMSDRGDFDLLECVDKGGGRPTLVEIEVVVVETVVADRVFEFYVCTIARQWVHLRQLRQNGEHSSGDELQLLRINHNVPMVGI